MFKGQVVVNGEVKFQVNVYGMTKVHFQGNVVVNSQVEVSDKVQAKGMVWIRS